MRMMHKMQPFLIAQKKLLRRYESEEAAFFGIHSTSQRRSTFA